MKKNNYIFINQKMKTHVEMFKQQVRAAKLISEKLETAKEAAKQNMVAEVLGTNDELLTKLK